MRVIRPILLSLFLTSVAAVLLIFTTVRVTPPAALQAAPSHAVPSPSPTPAPEKPLCPVDLPPHYYGSFTPDNDFGSPAVTAEEIKNPQAFINDAHSLPRVNKDLGIRWCGVDGEGQQGGDPLLSSAHFGVVDMTDPNRLFNEVEWRASMDAKIRRVQWENSRLGLNPAGMYYVMYMTENRRTGKLEVRVEYAWKEETLALYLPIVSTDGKVVTLTLRLECGFQPMFKHRSDVPPALLKYL